MKHDELMTGFPPTAAAQVTLANWRKPPFNKWSFTHVREIIPSADVSGAGASATALPHAPVDLSDLSIPFDGSSLTFGEFIDRTDTDGLVILHKGQIVHESYSPRMSATTPHILMSVSKSMLGLLAGILTDRGELDPSQRVTEIIPEVRETAYADASVRDLLDMRVGVKFEENYQAAGGAIIAYRKAQGWDPVTAGDEPGDLRSFFAQLIEVDGENGGNFHYVSPNTDLLGWVLERVTGKRYADLLSEHLWRPMGAETSGYITVDRFGAPRCAGGLCTTTRDLARVGQLLVNRGRVSGLQVVPEAWIDDIMTQGDREAWNGGDFLDYIPDLPIHYRSKWYVLNGEAPMIFGVGVHGQNVFADRNNDIVIAKFSSQPIAMDPALIQLTLAGVAAIRARLSKS
ncbi:MAG: 6-aminohexanoate-dimer hydrolase [Rhizobium sp.]|nr:6-aminohexanoate-dimer hydrolase [Rhizobium sp.]